MSAIHKIIGYLDKKIEELDKIVEKVFVNIYYYNHDKKPDKELIERAKANIDFEDKLINREFFNQENFNYFIANWVDYFAAMKVKAEFIRLKLEIKFAENEFDKNR